MNRVADTIGQILHRHGVRHAFGMPGGEVVTLIDGLGRAGIGFHLARHETAAAIMAGGTAADGKRPAVLVTTVGPGLANAVNGIADAAQERVPLIVLSGVVDRATRDRFTHQVIDQRALLAPLVKASFEVEAGHVAPVMERAIALAMTHPMGPVHIDVAPGTAALADPAPRGGEPRPPVLPAFHRQDPAIVELAGRLARAERPLILAGFEAARDRVGPALTALAEALGAPVVTTYKGKGVIAEDHPLALGGAGLSPAADAILLPLLAAADLLLFVGYDPIEMRIGWLDPAGDPAKVVDITALPPDHGMHGAGLRIAAAPAMVLSALVGHAGEIAHATWAGGEVDAARAALRQRFEGPHAFGPHAIARILQDAAGPEAVVTVDSGAHRILLSQIWAARAPLRLLQSAGFCTMAAALPLAIGAKVADPDRRVVAVMGDGGLEMGIGELATLRDLGLALTILVFQDESLALIAMKQAALGLKPAGVALGQSDFASIARGFGGHGVTVADGGDLRRALDESFAADRFTLIAARFSADAYANAF